MTATPKPDVASVMHLHEFLGPIREAMGGEPEHPVLAALLAEAPTMDLPEDHPYWEVPDELRRGMHWDRDLERFTARGDVARRLRDDCGWAAHGCYSGASRDDLNDRLVYEVRPPQRPKVTQVPAREVAKRLIDGERLAVHNLGMTEWWTVSQVAVTFTVSGSSQPHTYPWDSTVPVIEDTP